VLEAEGAGDATIERHMGALARTLVDASTGTSMLVLGSRGHSRVGEMIVGSVSQRAVRHAHSPVVVVRPPSATDADHVAVAVDGSEPSLRALDFACRHAGFTGKEVVLIRAWKPPATVPVDQRGDIPGSMSSTLLTEEEALDKTVAETRGRYPALTVEGRLMATEAGQALEDASRTAAMVVVGSRGRGAVAATVLGSVSHHVLHRAHCPVAVVHWGRGAGVGILGARPL
jgi:nucleotide-binding universal stress UspA family protein